MTTTIRRFRDGVDALPRTAAAGKLVTIVLCAFIGLISLTGLVQSSVVALSHREVEGVVATCRDAGSRAGVCTVEYGGMTAAVAATGVHAPRPGDRVPLWITGGEVRLAGVHFLYDALLTTGVLAASGLVLGALVTLIVRVGESNRRLYPD